MQPTLTAKQQRVLDYLQHEITTNGQVPSLRQAAAELGVSHAAIAQILKALEEKGYLKREGRYSRTVHLLNRARETSASQRWREVPVIGRVTAGVRSDGMGRQRGAGRRRLSRPKSLCPAG
jgi:repressor LexA